MNNLHLTIFESCKYLCCNMMPVAHIEVSEQTLIAAGAQLYDTYRVPATSRDGEINLFEYLGFDVMAGNVRVAYIVESAQILLGEKNTYWWKRRAGKGDIVLDATGSIQKIGVTDVESVDVHPSALLGVSA